MTEHPGTDHADVINILAATYDRYGWSEAALTGYLLALSDLDVDLLRRAAAEALRVHTGKMPAPADLRRLALRMAAGALPGPDEAWSEVRAAFGHVGRHRTPEWSHPLIGRTIEYLGGWSRLCLSHDPTGDRIAFIRTYQRLTERAEREALTAPGLAPAALTDGAPARQLPPFRLRQIPGGRTA